MFDLFDKKIKIAISSHFLYNGNNDGSGGATLKRADIEYAIKEIKMDYIRIQGDIEKLESTGQSVSNAEKMLKQMEDQLQHLNEQLLKCEE